MKTVAEAMKFIRDMTQVALSAIDKALLRQAIEILNEAASEQGTDLNSDDPLARSLGAAKTLASLLGVVSQGEPVLPGPPQTGGLARRLARGGGGGALFGDVEVDLSQSLATFVNEQTRAAAAAAGEDPSEIDEFEFPPLPPIPEVEGPAPRPIGVPVDFVAARQIEDPSPISLLAGAGVFPTTRAIAPQYFDGDELAPATLDPAVIARLQRRLVAAGLLDDDTFYVGAWDDLTIAAYKGVLGFANQNGIDATKSMDRLIATLPQSVKDARARAKQLKVFQEPPYIKPDMATLAQDVKRYFRQEVGRDPTAGEMAEFSAAMSSAYRADFEAEVGALRAAFNAENDPTLGVSASTEAGRLTRSIEAPVVPGGGGGTFQGVDPVARFREAFDRRLKPETDRLQGLSERRANVNNVYESLRTMTSLIGGGQ
jgi:hypothetical protein